MRDDLLISDLEQLSIPFSELSSLVDAGITSYSALFALLADEAGDEALRIVAARALFALWQTVDKRRAAPPLLVALQSPREGLRQHAAAALGMLQSRRAVVPLIAIATDKHQPEQVRVAAAFALGSIRDIRAAPALKQLIEDKTDSLLLRGVALEQIPDQRSESDLHYYIALLSAEEADIRFWAAFRIAGMGIDITPAREKLDAVVAFDHTVPTYFGWHVDREAILPLERIDYRLQNQDLSPEDNAYWAETWLISPAPEYTTFVANHRRRREDDHEPPPPPPPDLALDPGWLKAQIDQHYSNAAFQLRRLQAYLLDWRVIINGAPLMGALHRDRYAVVLTGTREAMQAFASWYRTIIQHTLYVYEWASEGVMLSE